MRKLAVTISDRLGRMDTALREKSEKDVSYLSLVRRPAQSWQATGSYRFDHSQGHIIQIVDELVAAMEITHGLMWMDGFLGVLTIDDPKEDEREVIAAFSDTVLHPAMRTYLRRFDFEKDYEHCYERKVRQWVQAKDMLALAEQHARETSIQALRFLEVILVNPLFQADLSQVSTELPLTWTLTRHLYEKVSHVYRPRPRGVWEAIVVIIKEVSQYLEKAKSPLMTRLVPLPVIAETELKSRASDVFELRKVGDEAGYLMVEIIYKPEPLSCVPVELSQSELASLQGRLDSFSAGDFSDAIASFLRGDSSKLNALASSSNSS